MDATRHWHAQYAKHWPSQVLAATTATEVKEVLWCAKAVVAVEKGITSLNFVMAIQVFTVGSSTTTVKSAPTLAHALVITGKIIAIVAGSISLLATLACRAHVGAKTLTTSAMVAMTLLVRVTAMTAVVPVGFYLTPRQALQYPLQGVGMDICVE